jgi:signal transduction histidine kinase
MISKEEGKMSMYQELKDSIFLLIPIVASLILSFVLAYLYYKDRNKRKLVFSFGLLVSAFGFYTPLIESMGLESLFPSTEWLFLPLSLAILIAALSSVLRIKNFDGLFIVFMIGTVASLVAYFAQFSNTTLRLGLMIIFASLAVPILIYTFIRSRSQADLNFLIATLCFLFEGVVMGFGTSVDIPVMLSLFGVVFIAFMFNRPENPNPSTLPSFILLEKKLDEANQNIKAMEEKLLKAERLAAIGELAGIIGHDLRNPLQGIRSAVYYLKTHCGDQGKVNREMLEEIDGCIDRSDKIINDLIEYAQIINLESVPTNPKSLVSHALARVKAPPNIAVVDETSDKPALTVDSNRIERVFEGIIKNAYDAMPDGGKLTISCKKSSGKAVFDFQDTGVGMDPETLSKMWTPLFTTKAKGMGLGLAICRRIIEAHGGSITAKSAIGRGTNITVTLPMHNKVA